MAVVLEIVGTDRVLVREESFLSLTYLFSFV